MPSEIFVLCSSSCRFARSWIRADQFPKHFVEGAFFTFKVRTFSGCTFFATCNPQTEISSKQIRSNLFKSLFLENGLKRGYYGKLMSL
jgi:hypothetical protein